MANPNRQQMPRFRKMADGILRTSRGYSITALLQFDDGAALLRGQPRRGHRLGLLDVVVHDAAERQREIGDVVVRAQAAANRVAITPMTTSSAARIVIVR